MANPFPTLALVLAAGLAVAQSARAETGPTAVALNTAPESAGDAAPTLAPETVPGAGAELAAVAPRARPPEPRASLRCSPDGGICISSASYIPDVCGAIERAAGASGLDAGFFARLIWRESLFDAAAVSPAGAQGIAQFMPETARLQGLEDSFNPAAALAASAAYLAMLSRDYGNLGLAAAAYNGGRARVERFLAREGGLALETRSYVHAITGHSAEDWRDAPPASVDLALAGEGDFAARCVALAATRGKRDTESGPPPPPWGVIIASNRNREGVERQALRLKNRNAALLREEQIHYRRSRLPGLGRAMYYAQVGRETRAEANAFCARLRATGGDCMVLRN